MAIARKIKKIEVVGELAHVFINEEIIEIENNEIIKNEPNHRRSIYPGQDYSNEPDKIKAVCAAVHTQAVIDAYNAHVAALEE